MRAKFEGWQCADCGTKGSGDVRELFKHWKTCDIHQAKNTLQAGHLFDGRMSIDPRDIPQSYIDPGYCGLGIETGPLDPWHKRICKPHDDAYNRLKAGDDDGGMRVAGKFVGGVLKGMAEGAWMLVTGPFYLVFGGIVGGLVRFGQLERRGKVKPKGFLRGDPNDGLGE